MGHHGGNNSTLPALIICDGWPSTSYFYLTFEDVDDLFTVMPMHGKRRSGREVYPRLNGFLSRDPEIMPLQVRPCYPEHLFHLLYCARPAWSVISLPA